MWAFSKSNEFEAEDYRETAQLALATTRGTNVSHKDNGIEWQYDAEKELTRFGVECARSAAHLWDGLTEKAREYLETESPELQEELWEGNWNDSQADFAREMEKDSSWDLTAEATGITWGLNNPEWKEAWEKIREKRNERLTEILMEGARQRGLI